MAHRKSDTAELLFTRCHHWNTQKCPHGRKAVMGLSFINRANLYVLSDKTVAELNALCRGCRVFKKKTSGTNQK